MIYIHNSLEATVINEVNVCDSLAIKVKVKTCELVIGCFYRSQSLTLAENKKMMRQIVKLCKTFSDNEEIFLVGDFNLPEVEWSTASVKSPVDTIDPKFTTQQLFVDSFLEAGLHWFIEDGTVTRRRWVDGVLQESLLDQVLTVNRNVVNNVSIVSPLGKSDHLGIVCNLKVANDLNYSRASKQCWSKFSIPEIKVFGNDVDWNYSSDILDVPQMWEELSKKLESISANVPTIDIKYNRNGTVITKPHWECTSLKRKRKDKDKAWVNFDECPNDTNLQYALFKQREYDQKQLKLVIKYEKKIANDMKTNPKRFYNYLNSKRKIKQSVTAVKNHHGDIAASPSETADLLAGFFSSTFIEEPLGPLPRECYCKHNESNISDMRFETASVKLALASLNCSKSFGPDSIHPKLLVALSDNNEFINAVTTLFNECYIKGNIPSVWKTAYVAPLHKKGSKLEAKNYRPISLTSILCKTYERLLREHIFNFVEPLISSSQHGFLNGKSCLSNLLESLDLMNDILAEGNCIDIFYLDFQKAFDTVPHGRLLTKLENYGITGKTLVAISDFLTNRSFVVRVGDSSSKCYKVTSGVPQGSVLGPLLFLLYINDLPGEIANFISLFADDVKMISNSCSPDDSQRDLDRLCKWQSQWLLKFNTIDNKCKVMHIGKDNPCNVYHMGGYLLPAVNNEKDLGVHITSDLSWDYHINESIKKAISCVAWVSRAVICRDMSVMLNIYRSLIRPHLEYCVQLWAPVPRYGNWKKIMDLEGVQAKFTRLIKGIGLMTYEERLSQLSLTTLLERRARGDLIETFKIINGLANYGKDFFTVSNKSSNIVIGINTNNRYKHDFLSRRVVKYWNKLPSNVKYSNSVATFKSRLEAFKSKNYNKKGNYWELSEEIFSRTDGGNREGYRAYMTDNPGFAKAVGVNIY